MTTPFENPISSYAPVFLVLMAVFLLGFGCNTSKPTPDPLAGYHRGDEANMDKNKAITDDYKTYIHTLSPDEQKYAGPILFYEDGTGQHAVVIEVDLKPNAWNHVLIYDKDNVRIKVMKYIDHQFRS
jgi:hypothetical protein